MDKRADGTNKFGLRLIASPEGFAVYDNSGRKLAVAAVDLFVRPGQPPMMMVALPAGNVDVVGKVLFAVVDPELGKPRVVTRIEWADGSVSDYPAPEQGQTIVSNAGQTVVSNGPEAPAA